MDGVWIGTFRPPSLPRSSRSSAKCAREQDRGAGSPGSGRARSCGAAPRGARRAGARSRPARGTLVGERDQIAALVRRRRAPPREPSRAALVGVLRGDGAHAELCGERAAGRVVGREHERHARGAGRGERPNHPLREGYTVQWQQVLRAAQPAAASGGQHEGLDRKRLSRGAAPRGGAASARRAAAPSGRAARRPSAPALRGATSRTR